MEPATQSASFILFLCSWVAASYVALTSLRMLGMVQLVSCVEVLNERPRFLLSEIVLEVIQKNAVPIPNLAALQFPALDQIVHLAARDL